MPENESVSQNVNPSTEGAASEPAKKGFIKRFFFGSFTRGLITLIVVVFALAFIPSLRLSPEREVKDKDLKGGNHNIPELAETIEALRKKVEVLQQENDDLKNGRGRKEGVSLNEEVNFQRPSDKDVSKFSPPSVSNPYEGLKDKVQDTSVNGGAPQYKPMRVITAPPALPGSQINVSTDSARQDVTKKEKEKNLQSGSSAMGRLQNGIAAVAGLPYPVVIDLASPSKGPNSYSTPIKDCAVLAIASADISVERINLQPKKLTCYIGDEFVEQEVDGYVVDTRDNIFGIKGKVDDRQSSYVIPLLLSSLASGISKGLAQVETTTSYSALDTQKTTVSGDYLRYGLYRGGESMAEQISKRLEKKADQFVSFVQIEANNTVKVFFTTSVHIPSNAYKVDTGELTWIK